MKLSFTLNDKEISVQENPNKRLSTFLREHHYFSVKSGCNNGECGSCSVLLNDIPVASCSLSLARISGCKIITLESFMKTDNYSDIEKGFKQAGITLCGFCNAGKIFLSYKIISTVARPSKEEINKEISFLSCNCVEKETLINGIYFSAAYRRARIKEVFHG